MSIALMAEVWKVTLPDSEKLVLLALADCANDEGACWPSMATLVKKCSKTDRTIQACVKSLVERGHLTRDERPGKGCLYKVHPKATPEAASPRKDFPPKRTTQTPEAASDKPSRTIKQTNTARAHVMPADWKPVAFGPGSKCREVTAQWTADEFASQIEHFTKHHRGKGSRFVSWQDAWETWVLNSRKWGPRPTRGTGPPGNDSGGYLDHYLAKQARRSSG